MAMSLFQKFRLGLRGWNRRRAEASAKRDAEFLAKETSWGKTAAATVAPATPRDTRPIDLEGLQVAYLDNSGRISYYLDTETGEVIEGGAADSTRYRLVPNRSAESEAADRHAFVATVAKADMRRALSASLADADAFRKALSTDRAVERAWYNFKNQRAADAIDHWLKSNR